MCLFVQKRPTFLLLCLFLFFLHAGVVQLERDKVDKLAVVEGAQDGVQCREVVLTEQCVKAVEHDPTVTVIQLQTTASDIEKHRHSGQSAVVDSK